MFTLYSIYFKTGFVIPLPELCPSLIAMEDAKTPAGSAVQERPRRRFGAEEAHRPPRGKRSVWNGNQQPLPTNKLKRTADDFIFKQLWL
ncbi:hypothetical protein A4244_02730 [Bacillus badius]|nr:hypothetical protein A4244_02730 [Bacillus badius]OCS88198.1 hypothetical protein A6M11_02730 [Bacillus badius]